MQMGMEVDLRDERLCLRTSVRKLSGKQIIENSRLEILRTWKLGSMSRPLRASESLIFLWVLPFMLVLRKEEG